MTGAKDLKDFSAFCAGLSHDCLTAIHDLGPKPADAAAAATWQQRRDALGDLMDQLSEQAGILAAQAVNAALDAVEDALSAVSAATDKAQAEIKTIKQISDFISRVAQVVDLALAVAAAVPAPTAKNLQAVLAGAKALGDPLKADAAKPPAPAAPAGGGAKPQKAKTK